MKKMISGIVVCAVLGIAVSAMGYGIPGVPSSIDSATKEVTKKGMEKGLNDKLAKENCAYNDATTVDPADIQCKSGSIDNVLNYVSDWHNGLEGSIANDFNLTVKVSGDDKAISSRQSRLQNKVDSKMNYWDNIVNRSGNTNNAVSLSVSVK